MKFFTNAAAFVTMPVWWPMMVAVECAQILFGVDCNKLIGVVISDKLSKNRLAVA